MKYTNEKYTFPILSMGYIVFITFFHFFSVFLFDNIYYLCSEIRKNMQPLQNIDLCERL